MKTKHLAITALIAILAIAIFTFNPHLTAKADNFASPSPSIRYLTFENITEGWCTDRPGLHTWGTQFVFSFALFKVVSWGDWCYFNSSIIANGTTRRMSWQFMFDNSTPPNLAGAGSYGSDMIETITYTADCPYKNQTINNPVDGNQTYYFYRTHVWLKGDIDNNTIVQLTSDYNHTYPTTQTMNIQNIFVKAAAVSDSALDTGSWDAVALSNETTLDDGSITFALTHLDSLNPPPNNTYNVNVNVGSHGSCNTSTQTIGYNSALGFAFKPEAGYHVADVKVNASSVGSPDSLSLIITGNTTVKVDFSINTYGIASSAGNGGVILPNGNVSVNYGGNQAFVITANNGYYVAGVLVNGASVGAVSSYTIQNAAGKTTISAIFTANPTSTATPEASPTPNPSSDPTPTTSNSPSATPTPNPPDPTLTTSTVQIPTSTPAQSISLPNPTQTSSSPQPLTPVPEIPSIIMLAIILVFASGVLIFHKKYQKNKKFLSCLEKLG